MCLLQEVENFKKLNVISQDEFDTLSPKVPVDSNQEVPPPPMPGGSVELLLSSFTQAEMSPKICKVKHTN